MLNYLQFRYRRFMRRTRRDTRLLSRWATNYVERHIWGKWHQLRVVRRFLVIWWILIAVSLGGLLQQIGFLQRVSTIAVAEPGGTYIEAAVGTVQTLNPILPESTASADVNRLLFSGLTRYNSRRQIVPDLASWDVSADGKSYTFRLRRDVKWHDGQPLTAADVAFTLTAIQNPDSRSPLASSWQGVSFETKGDYTITMKLPQPLSSFLDSTTVGILPRHKLESVEPSTLREATFNQAPVGSGPFKMKTFAPSARTVELTANPHYHFGRPKLDEFIFRFYDAPADALTAFTQHQVTSPGRLDTTTTPEELTRDGQLELYDFTLPEEETLFFATSDKLLSDKRLRQILTRSLDRQRILKIARAGQGVTLTQPLLPGQTGYTTKYAPSALSAGQARNELAAAGWGLPRGSQVRIKNNARLQFKLVTLAGGELERAADEIKRQWDDIGVGIEVVAVSREQLQQSYMRPRNFQMLLYGVNLGSDPDVYSFWHSSQTKDPGVNLSGYSSLEADRALETGRIKSDSLIRQGKYDAFLKAWNADTPAAVLYQQGYTYGARSGVEGIRARRLVTGADRFYGVEHWTVRQRFVLP